MSDPVTAQDSASPSPLDPPAELEARLQVAEQRMAARDLEGAAAQIAAAVELRRGIETAAEAAGTEAPPAPAARLMIVRARLSLLSGRGAEAEQQSLAAMALAEGAGDSGLRARALSVLAAVLQVSGRIVDAAIVWQEALDRAMESGEPGLVETGARAAAQAATSLAKAPGAQESLEQLVVQLRASQNPHRLGLALWALGNADAAAGFEESASETFLEAADALGSAGRRLAAAHAGTGAAQMLHRMGRTTEALQILGAACEAYAGAKSNAMLGVAEATRASMLSDNGELDPSEASWIRAVEAFAAAGNFGMAAKAAFTASRVRTRANDTAGVVRWSEEAVRHLESAGNPVQLGVGLFGLAAAKNGAGDSAGAEATFARGEKLLLESTPAEARAETIQAVAEARRDMKKAARKAK